MGCELGGNSGLISIVIVIVIVIECHFVPLFFFKNGILIFVLLGIIITEDCFHSGFALGSLWVRSGSTPKSGGKVEAKWRQNGMKNPSFWYMSDR